jgi:hypothetical protein
VGGLHVWIANFSPEQASVRLELNDATSTLQLGPYEVTQVEAPRVV